MWHSIRHPQTLLSHSAPQLYPKKVLTVQGAPHSTILGALEVKDKQSFYWYGAYVLNKKLQTLVLRMWTKETDKSVRKEVGVGRDIYRKWSNSESLELENEIGVTLWEEESSIKLQSGTWERYYKQGS